MLFIWAESACRFISNGSSANARLQQILHDTQPTQGSQPLDVLYTTAISYSLDDNTQNLKLCLGVIVATAACTPLSVLGLEVLLAVRIESGVLVTCLASIVQQGFIKAH